MIPRPRPTRAFTLIELLVVVAIIAILIAILVPSLEKAHEHARNAVCGENLHQIAVALTTYSNEFNNALPLGPAANSPLARPWNQQGDNTLWIASTQQYNGLGLLLNSSLRDPRIFVCPIENDPHFKPQLLASLGSSTSDARGSYLYRQLDQNSSDRLSVTGANAFNTPARALVMDWQSPVGPVPYLHNSHDFGEYLNILYTDGHAQSFADPEKMQGDAAAYASMPASYLHRLDQIWTTADFAETHNPNDAPTLP